MSSVETNDIWMFKLLKKHTLCVEILLSFFFDELCSRHFFQCIVILLFSQWIDLLFYSELIELYSCHLAVCARTDVFLIRDVPVQVCKIEGLLPWLCYFNFVIQFWLNRGFFWLHLRQFNLDLPISLAFFSEFWPQVDSWRVPCKWLVELRLGLCVEGRASCLCRRQDRASL